MRQKDVVEPWINAGGHEMPAYVVDEGTSGAKDPFQRQSFREAIALCQEHEAQGIVVEAIDRATRGGVEAFMVLKSNLRLDYELTIKSATTPPGLPPAVEELYESTMAMVARMWRDRHAESVKTGIARAKAAGFPNGSPGRAPKPPLTLAEKELVRDLVIQGKGVDLVALELSRARGAFDVGDPGVRDRRKVGPTWTWKQIRSQMPDLCERLTARRKAYSPRPTSKKTGDSAGQVAGVRQSEPSVLGGAQVVAKGGAE
jgi:DNA invertase Pin-like site-specific DNA recombinase